MILMDSSGWLAILQRAPGYEEFARRLQEAEEVLVPTIVLCEVYKVVYRLNGLSDAVQAAALLRQRHVAPLDEAVAIHAGELAVDERLSTADAIIYATAQIHEAVLVTGDAHFQRLAGVEYLPWTDG